LIDFPTIWDAFINGLWKVVDFLETHNGAVTAAATVFIGIFTYVLARVTRRQAILTRESINLARDEFNATHRPKIVVQAVWFNEMAAVGESLGTIHFNAVNVGDSRATIVNFIVYPFIQQKGYPFAPKFFEPEAKKRQAITLAPGEPVSVVENYEFTDEHYWKLHGQEAKLFVVGRIEYIGNDGVRRITGFCRERRGDDDSWIATDHADYEYAY
jgi:hypothetical protein